MSLKIKDATLIEELADYLMFAVGNTEGDTDGAVTLGQVKDYTDTDKALVAFTGSYLNLSDAPNLESYVLMDTLTQNYYNRNQVNQLIGGISGPKFEKVEELPEQGENNVIYLIPDETAQQDNIFDEYIWIPDGRMFEKIGSTAADFENYYTIEEVDAMIPSVNNPTITFQQGGVTKGTITLNQSSAATINFDESFEQEQADWNQRNPAAADYIKNKPNIPVVNDTIMTISQGGVQKGVFSLNQEGPETIDLDAQVQADWDQEDDSEDDYIKNKPETFSLKLVYDDCTHDIVDFYVKNVTTYYDFFYIQNEHNQTNYINISTKKIGTPVEGTYATTLEYSLDGTNWTAIDISTTQTTRIPLNVGERVYFRNDNGCFNGGNPLGSNYIVTKFTSASHFRFSVGGNINSLLNYRENISTLKPYCFNSLFSETQTQSRTGLINVPELNYTTLADGCFEFMYDGCKSITVALPDNYLPATTIAKECYHDMFKNTGVTKAPVLPATTLEFYCYRGMFSGCTSLNTVPSNMLPATTLAYGCYQILFSDCLSLINAPVLPATVLTDYCYSIMFRGTQVTEITTYADDISASNCLKDWLITVPATGTFHNLGSATYPSGSSGIPSGWTEVNS